MRFIRRSDAICQDAFRYYLLVGRETGLRTASGVSSSKFKAGFSEFKALVIDQMLKKAAMRP